MPTLVFISSSIASVVVNGDEWLELKDDTMAICVCVCLYVLRKKQHSIDAIIFYLVVSTVRDNRRRALITAASFRLELLPGLS